MYEVCIFTMFVLTDRIKTHTLSFFGGGRVFEIKQKAHPISYLVSYSKRDNNKPDIRECP